MAKTESKRTKQAAYTTARCIGCSLTSKQHRIFTAYPLSFPLMDLVAVGDCYLKDSVGLRLTRGPMQYCGQPVFEPAFPNTSWVFGMARQGFEPMAMARPVGVARQGLVTVLWATSF